MAPVGEVTVDHQAACGGEPGAAVQAGDNLFGQPPVEPAVVQGEFGERAVGAEEDTDDQDPAGAQQAGAVRGPGLPVGAPLVVQTAVVHHEVLSGAGELQEVALPEADPAPGGRGCVPDVQQVQAGALGVQAFGQVRCLPAAPAAHVQDFRAPSGDVRCVLQGEAGDGLAGVGAGPGVASAAVPVAEGAGDATAVGGVARRALSGRRHGPIPPGFLGLRRRPRRVRRAGPRR